MFLPQCHHTIRPVSHNCRNQQDKQNIRHIYHNKQASTTYINKLYQQNEEQQIEANIDLQNYTGDDYKKLRHEEIRKKIDNETKLSDIYFLGIQAELEKVIRRIHDKSVIIQQKNHNYEKLCHEHEILHEQLRKVQLMGVSTKENIMSENKILEDRLRTYKRDKSHIVGQIHAMAQTLEQRNRDQIQLIQSRMQQKLHELNNILKNRLNEKNKNRQQLIEIKEQIISYKLQKQKIWNNYSKVPPRPLCIHRTENFIQNIQKQIQQVQSNLTRENRESSLVIKNLMNTTSKKHPQKQKNILNQINILHKKLKQKHMDMTLKNLQIQKSKHILILKENQINSLNSELNMLHNYNKHLEINYSIEKQYEENVSEIDKNREEIETQQIIITNISKLEEAIKIEQRKSRTIKDQYERLLGILDGRVRRQIQDKCS